MKSIESPFQKVTVNLPRDLLEGAMKSSGLGVTETLREALEEYRKYRAYDALRALRGKMTFSVDIETLRHDRE